MRFASLLESLPAQGGVVLNGEKLSTEKLLSLALRAAEELRRRGVAPGDRVAGLLDNGTAFFALWFGAAFAGATFVPINTRLRGDTLRYILEDAAAKFVLDQDQVPAWMESVARCPEGKPAGEGGGVIIYTSGTTGRPKGVVWSAETQAWHARAYARELVQLEAGEHSYSCLPLFHVTCMGVTLSSLQHGATVHLDPRFSVSSFWQRIAESGAAFFPYVGSILSLLLKDERTPPPHRARAAMGAAAPAEVFTRFQARFGVKLLETYGQTELASIWLMNTDGRPGSIGRPCERAEARLAPVEGVIDAGELQIRPKAPAYMMAGYHGNAEATREAWQDGWYRTRDLAALDADGSYRFVGRLADCVRRRGENVSAFEVEQAILKHPDVVEAAVVGVDSELGEQDLALYYVERAPGAVPVAGLERWCRSRLSDFMVPRYYVPVGQFPKTETQRVQKGLLHSEVRLRGGYDADKKEHLR
jgi:crotonobetaine/carnitine-CoA ligase